MSRTVIALDIGTKAAGSGAVCFETTASPECPVSAKNTRLLWAKMDQNPALLHRMRYGVSEDGREYEWVIEGLSARADKAGNSTFATLLWVGQMLGTIETRRELGDKGASVVLRSTVTSHLRATARGKGAPTTDKQVADVVRVRFGGMAATDSQLKGTKGNPGPLYGVKQDIWQALGLGIAYVEGAELDESWKR